MIARVLGVSADCMCLWLVPPLPLRSPACGSYIGVLSVFVLVLPPRLAFSPLPPSYPVSFHTRQNPTSGEHQQTRYYAKPTYAMLLISNTANIPDTELQLHKTLRNVSTTQTCHLRRAATRGYQGSSGCQGNSGYQGRWRPLVWYHSPLRGLSLLSRTSIMPFTLSSTSMRPAPFVMSVRTYPGCKMVDVIPCGARSIDMLLTTMLAAILEHRYA